MDANPAELKLAAAIAELTRELRRTTPAPRTAPYFMLDSGLPYDPAVLESLSAPGIFRKYELVLLIHEGLGGTARWLSRRLACRVIGVDAAPQRGRAAGLLNGLTRMNDEVSFAAAQSVRLPFRDRVFTHVWMVEPTTQDYSAGALAEAFRVLRSGAHFALQTSSADGQVRARIESDLVAAGFIDLTWRAAKLLPPDQTTTLARARLQAMIGSELAVRKTTRRQALAPGLRSLEVGAVRARPAADLTCTQIFCRRP
jgi:SAM-dependent methyltransferase